MRIGLIDAFGLKLLMCGLMLLDHLHYYFPSQMPLWFYMLGRLVAPVFVFLMTEGMAHTRNRLRYLCRLFVFGGFMLAGNWLLGSIYGTPIRNSIFFSLGIAAAVIFCLEKSGKKEGGGIFWLLPVAGLIFLAQFFEGNVTCTLLGILFYFLRDRKGLMTLAYLAASIFLSMVLYGSRLQLLMIFALIPILLYNGKRGWSNAFTKYFFYVFYPAHIWALYLIKMVVG